jgi:hypothetical protein
MNRALALSVTILFHGSSVGTQAPNSTAPAPQTIEACQADLTEAGRAASFQGTAFYEVVSNSDGTVLTVRPVKIPEVFNVFVQLPEFRACVQRWRFTGGGTTTVALSAGTTGELLVAWRISVITGTGTFNLVLPRSPDR